MLKFLKRDVKDCYQIIGSVSLQLFLLKVVKPIIKFKVAINFSQV